jgi:hypothetical protein
MVDVNINGSMKCVKRLPKDTQIFSWTVYKFLKTNLMSEAHDTYTTVVC